MQWLRSKNSSAALMPIDSDASQDEAAVKLLLIEDQRPDAVIFEKLLRKARDGNRYSIVTAERLSDAMMLLKSGGFDIVVSDLSLPDSEGLRTVETIRSNCPFLTLVVLTGLKNEEIGLTAIQCGAQDYLVKGSFTGDELSLSIKFAMERQRAVIDVSADRTRFQYRADHDALTDLPNRNLFQDRLGQAIALAKRDSKIFAILFLDLDGFKEVNDAFGHKTGDLLLKALSEKFHHLIRESDTVARIGGDEFVFLLYDLKKEQDAAIVARKLMKVFKEPIFIESNKLYLSGSVGISLYPSDSTNGEELIEIADSVMYQAKELGKQQFRFKSSRLNFEERSSSEEERALLHAFESKQLEIHYQPQMNLETGQVASVQALLRWNHPEWGYLTAQDFIPLAESSGLILQINEWLLESACNQLKEWRRGSFPHLKLFLNLSKAQFQKPELASSIPKVIERAGLLPSSVIFEVTESAILENRDRNITFLKNLSSAGAGLALDSFGTGHCSVGNIRSVPFAALKIDRSLIADLKEDESTHGFVKAMIEVAHGLGMTSIAEGVENETQVQSLKKLGCQLAQGYVFGRPDRAESIKKVFSGEEEISVEGGLL